MKKPSQVWEPRIVQMESSYSDKFIHLLLNLKLKQKSRSKRRALKAKPGLTLQYNAGKCSGPDEIDIVIDDLKRELAAHEVSLAKQLDFGWFLARLGRESSILGPRENVQSVPGWSGFNAAVADSPIPSVSVVGYCPMIDASPTELPTVYTL